MRETEESRGAPLVCGALGQYERGRVERMATVLGAGLRIAHEDDASILMIDREPLAWQGRRERGLGWIEGAAWRGGANDWKQASTLGACGLVISGRRRFIHSAINGLAPVYWTQRGDATYFASRLEPLARSAPDRLSVDWEAWASIFAMRYPLGERTPFAEIRRLGPFASLHRRFRRSRVESPSWPWSELEPHLDVEAGAEATAAALGEALASVEGEALCPLSGGFDSRVLLSALVASGRVEPTALTVNDDEGAPWEEDFASTVALRLGIPHELIVGRVDEYWDDLEERARRVEHQLVDHPWLVPLARRIAGAGAPVYDGYALDVFLQTGARFHTPEVLDTSDPQASDRALFDSLRRYGHGHEGLAESFHSPVLERARAQFHAAVKPFTGHPSQPLLALYATRTVRGVSTYPSGLLGRQARILAPGADHATVLAMLAVPSAEKREQRLISALQRRLMPRLADLPSTNDTLRPPGTMPRRWCSPIAIEGHRRSLADGPLAEHIAPELIAWLEDPGRGELPADLRVGMETITIFHDWWRLYRDVLGEVDADELRKP